MDKLIEALQIMLKYGNPSGPTCCSHDVLMIHPDIDPDKVSDEDKAKLKDLGFFVVDECGMKTFHSFRYGR